MLHIQGPTFLLLYLGLFAAALASYDVLRRTLGGRAARPGPDELSAVTAAEAGLLAAGSSRSTWAAIAHAHEAGEVDAPTIDLPEVQLRLEQRGLILTEAQAGLLRLVSAVLFGSMLATGGARMIIGLSRGKPVALLVLLMMAVAVALLATLRRRVRRTRAGDKLLAALRARYHDGQGDRSGAMGVALIGAAALTDHPELQAHLRGLGLPLGAASLGGGGSGIVGCAAGCGAGGGSGCGSGCGGGCGGCGS